MALKHAGYEQVFERTLMIVGDLLTLRKLLINEPVWKFVVDEFNNREEERCKFGVY